MYIYPRLRDLREDKDLTQADVAKILNIGLTTYRRYEVGEREIPFHFVILLANYYKVSIDYIAGLTNINKTERNTKNNITAKNNVNITNVNNNSGKITIK